MLKTVYTHSAGLFAAAMARPNPLAKLAAMEEARRPKHEKDARQRLRDEADARALAAKEQLLPKLTPEFLATLAMLSRYSGESTEYGPVVNVIDTYRLAGVEPQDVQPVNFLAP